MTPYERYGFIHMKLFSVDIRQSGLKVLAIIVLLISFISSLWINFGIRAPIEARDDTIGLVVDYDELKRLADGSYGIEFSDMLRKAYLAGATGLAIRERILSDWEIAGDVTVFSGGQLRFQLEEKYGTSDKDTIAGITVVPGKTYILTKDPLVFEQIYSLLNAKKRYPESFELEGYMGIAAQLHSSERATLGLGFPLSQLEEAAAAGFEIIPRLRSWQPTTAESLAESFRWVTRIPNLVGIGFNDTSVPGGGTDPEIQDLLANQVKALGKPLVSFEFYDQIGMPGLMMRLDNNLLRAHAIAENEIRNYTNFQDAMDRYSLAVSERNIRYIFLRFYGLENPAASMVSNMDLITNVRDGLLATGLKMGSPEPIPDFKVGKLPLFLLGTGVIAAGGWLLALGFEPFIRTPAAEPRDGAGSRRPARKWRLPYAILIAFGFIVWAGLLYIAPTMSRKLLALASAIVFSSLGVLLVIAHEPNARTLEARTIRMLRAVGQFLVVTLVSFAGAMITSALLADPSYMLKMNSFIGVKVAHVIPLILVACILLLRNRDWYGVVSGIAKSSIKVWQLAVGLVILAGLVFYVIRTGSDNPDMVTGLELRVRQFLDNFLGVRPRTKELLIGHPLMLILLYFGYRYTMIPVLIIGVIGQVSIINTYTHIHTPLMVSLQRSAHGLWMGTVIGIIAIVILEWIISKIRKAMRGAKSEG